MKLFFELIKNGLAFADALKGASVTEEQVKQFLAQEGETITLDQLSDKVAEKVLAKITAKAAPTTPPPAAQAAVDVEAIVKKAAEAMSAQIDEKVAAAAKRMHPNLDPAAAPKSAAVIPGKPIGYAKLQPHQKQLFDMIVAARKGGHENVDQQIDLSDGEINQIRASRKISGLSDTRQNGRPVTVWGRGAKALDSTANDGADWIPTNLATAMHLRMGEITSIAEIFDQFTQSSPIEDYPVGTTRPSVYLETTTTGSGTESSLRTAKATMTAKKIIGKTDIQDDTAEDSIINLMPVVEQSLVEAMINAQANAIINGDTTSTHMDTDTETVATHSNRAWKGLRRLSLGVTGLYADLATGGITTGNLAALISKLGKYALRENAGRCRIILGVKGVTTARGLSAFTDFASAGSRYSLITGELPPFLGVPFAIESLNREDMNASGVYDGSTKTKGCVIVVYGGGFVLSTYKDVSLESERVASSQKTVLYTKFRKAFTPFETPSETVPVVAIGYNYAS